MIGMVELNVIDTITEVLLALGVYAVRIQHAPNPTSVEVSFNVEPDNALVNILLDDDGCLIFKCKHFELEDGKTKEVITTVSIPYAETPRFLDSLVGIAENLRLRDTATNIIAAWVYDCLKSYKLRPVLTRSIPTINTKLRDCTHIGIEHIKNMQRAMFFVELQDCVAKIYTSPFHTKMHMVAGVEFADPNFFQKLETYIKVLRDHPFVINPNVLKELVAYYA